MKGNENMITYEFKIAIDGGAAFQETRVMRETARGYEYAEEAAMRKLRDEFCNSVAFFNVIDWRRV